MLEVESNAILSDSADDSSPKLCSVELFDIYTRAWEYFSDWLNEWRIEHPEDEREDLELIGEYSKYTDDMLGMVKDG